jgi:hypothetical protein
MPDAALRSAFPVVLLDQLGLRAGSSRGGVAPGPLDGSVGCLVVSTTVRRCVVYASQRRSSACRRTHDPEVRPGEQDRTSIEREYHAAFCTHQRFWAGVAGLRKKHLGGATRQILEPCGAFTQLTELTREPCPGIDLKDGLAKEARDRGRQRGQLHAAAPT